MSASSELWVPPSSRENFRKAPAPRTGPSYGTWGGRSLTYLELPGGGAMGFDLSKLTLADYRQMRSHYQVNVSQLVLMFMIHQQDWTVQSENGPKADRKIADRVDTIIRNAWTPLIRGLSQSFWAGFSPMALEWDNDGPSSSVILSKVKDLVPEECWVNWQEVEGVAGPNGAAPKLFEYDGIAQQAGPGSWFVDGRGQAAGGGSYVIPAEYTLWYPLLMENGDFYGRKLLKPAFVPWFFSMLIHLFANRYFERFGEPVPVGRADFEDTLIDANGDAINGRDAMLGILENLRNRGVVVLPSDRNQIGDSGKSEYAYDIQYLESQMRGADFERYLARLDEEISVGMFTPFSAMRMGDNGSHNALQVQMQLYQWMLNALTGDMKHYIDNFLVKPIVEFNFGLNAPRMKWEPRKFGKDSAETLRFLLQEGVRVGDFKPDIEELGIAAGITLEDTSMLIRADNMPLPSGSTVPSEGLKNQAQPTDPRIGRGTHQDRTAPKTGDAGVIRSRMAARLKVQFSRAKRTNTTAFVPDLGHSRQLADYLDNDTEAAQIATRLHTWAADAYPVVDDVDAMVAMFEHVYDDQLDAA